MMTQNELFAFMLVCIVMWISGAVELSRRNYSLGTFMVLIPIIGIVAKVFGK